KEQPGFVTDLSPERLKGAPVALHIGEGLVGGAHHTLAWYDALKQRKIPFIIICRSLRLYDFMRQKYGFEELVCLRTAKDVENLMEKISKPKLVLYPANTGNNIHLVRYPDICHVFIGHGDSDKASS